MSKNKTFVQHDPAQSERFIEAAKKDGITEVGAAFRRDLVLLAPVTKPTPKKPARKPKRAKRA